MKQHRVEVDLVDDLEAFLDADADRVALDDRHDAVRFFTRVARGRPLLPVEDTGQVMPASSNDLGPQGPGRPGRKRVVEEDEALTGIEHLAQSDCVVVWRRVED